MTEEALAFTTAGALEGALFAAVERLAAPLSSSWRETKHIIIIVIVGLGVFVSAARATRPPSHLGQLGELPLRDDGAPPQVVDADVVGRRGHGRLHAVVVAEGPPVFAYRGAEHLPPRKNSSNQTFLSTLPTEEEVTPGPRGKQPPEDSCAVLFQKLLSSFLRSSRGVGRESLPAGPRNMSVQTNRTTRTSYRTVSVASPEPVASTVTSSYRTVNLPSPQPVASTVTSSYRTLSLASPQPVATTSAYEVSLLPEDAIFARLGKHGRGLSRSSQGTPGIHGGNNTVFAIISLSANLIEWMLRLNARCGVETEPIRSIQTTDRLLLHLLRCVTASRFLNALHFARGTVHTTSQLHARGRARGRARSDAAERSLV
ncbi:hypothetical protein EYF80_049188 [Liparis tanakae]|uniref:Uncharacterized protein n=1 Tax=Liparis tanakae TaxID=230148 RepID=A0A4Z2FHK7_9TELE|nr:hypothetical protein EYF80_049188 [Liparis tanakae]